MLDLDICRKCCLGDINAEWHEDTEGVIREIKKRNYVACPGADAFHSLKGYLDQPPPPHCQHKLEHGVSAALENQDA